MQDANLMKLLDAKDWPCIDPEVETIPANSLEIDGESRNETETLSEFQDLSDFEFLTGDYGEPPSEPSTSEINPTYTENDDPKTDVENWFDQTAKPKVEQQLSTEALIQKGIELAGVTYVDGTHYMDIGIGNFTDRAIQIGRICLALKKIIKSERRGKWSPWAEKNLPFLEKRNREKFMALAKRSDCCRFSFLGVDRLDVLCSVTKKLGGTDPIGDLLTKYSVSLPETNDDRDQFKAKIDDIVANERKKSL
jgi:hypothetical protein